MVSAENKFTSAITPNYRTMPAYHCHCNFYSFVGIIIIIITAAGNDRYDYCKKTFLLNAGSDITNVAEVFIAARFTAHYRTMDEDQKIMAV